MTTAAVDVRQVPHLLQASGSFVAGEQSQVAPPTPGLVVATPVEVGDFVQQGHTLARLDDRDARLRLQQAQAQLALAQLALARKAVADTVVRAPFAGYVSQRSIAAGEHVGENSAIVTLVQLTPIKLDVQVPEAEASRLHSGLGVDVRVAGFGSRIFHGAVTAISPSVDVNSRTLLVEARFANQDRALRPGMFATASVLLPGSDTALFVPQSAVIDDTSTDSRQLYVVDGKQARLHVVQTGERDGEQVRILNGLQPGEQVIAHPQPSLFDGALIALQPARP